MKSNANKLPLKRISQFLLICLLFLTGCDSFGDFLDRIDPNKEITNSALNISDHILILQKEVPQSGGEIIVETPGDINGLKITISNNSYSGSKQFEIYSAKINSHELGQYFNPITPLIQIGNGGGYANGIMELEIPVSLPEGHIPIGFFYNQIEETLEGIPLKEYTSNSVTLLTRHFMSASDLNGSDFKNGFVDNIANIVVGSISENLLKGITTINSGFEMGKDNWEFSNYGSYISPGGQCAGQNMAAMWYYFEKKLKGEPNLNNRFSTIQPFEQDNALGFRFCSVIQKDLDWYGLINNFFTEYIDKNQDLDLTKFYTIAATMLITGEPQGIGIWRLKGYDKNNEPIYGGHDLICYKVDMPSAKLFICDPNWPKDAQEIILQNNKFQSYTASSNAYTSTYQYEYVNYYAKTAFIEWNKVGKRFEQVMDSTIGTVAPNTFPSYKIWAIEKKVDTDITNADKEPFLIYSDTLRCIVECPEAELFREVSGKKRIDFDVYDINGKQVDIYESGGVNYSLLKTGWNKLGFYIYGWRTGYTDNNGDYRKKFIDFKWIDVYRSDLKIEPNPISGKPGEEISIQAKTESSLSSNVRYEWDFGDGTTLEVVSNNNSVKHIFEKGGTFTVSVSLFNDDTNELIAKASAEARIEIINIEDGTFKDLRDGTIYKYVNIGDQVWMAENLAFDAGEGSWVYENNNANIDKYGRLYTWDVAIDGSASSNSNPSGVKGVCPDGWHLPSDAEWEQLAQYISTQNGGYDKRDDDWFDVGKHLKTTTGWRDNGVNSGNGTDDYGFSGLPAGYRRVNGNWELIGFYGYWWSTSEIYNDYAWRRSVNYYETVFDRHSYLKGEGFSVRCVKD